MGCKEINWGRTGNIPPPPRCKTPPLHRHTTSTHTSTVGKYTHTPLSVPTAPKDKNPRSSGYTRIYFPTTEYVHTYTCTSFMLHKTQARFPERSLQTPPWKTCSQKWLLQPKEREAAGYRFDCHSGLWQIPSFPSSPWLLSLAYCFPQSPDIKEFFSWTLSTNTLNPFCKSFKC